MPDATKENTISRNQRLERLGDDSQAENKI